MQLETGCQPGATRLLRRQQLVWLDEDGWGRVLSGRSGSPGWDLQACECLEHWAAHDLALVVTRQLAGRIDADSEAVLTLGLPAPARWGRRRLLVGAPRSAVRSVGEFPLATSLLPALPPSARNAWSALCEGFDRQLVTARIYGSYGWDQLTGLDHRHPDSDIDLQLTVSSSMQADAAVALLMASGIVTPRLDGEICFADGGAVAWREWAQGRSGQMRQLLVKSLAGATLKTLAELVGAR